MRMQHVVLINNCKETLHEFAILKDVLKDGVIIFKTIVTITIHENNSNYAPSREVFAFDVNRKNRRSFVGDIESVDHHCDYRNIICTDR
ncbi:hypothetical protein FPSE_02432 [Fusarium pseudograminearum CS3096]|uniref:Uncharacterized protein n=1 Tax=Fusarium pseudograminearum (strain CS3096) TaxID=1028729 RepID=K3VQP9_FUSPC|nr:hypothetical protein FPSE_02432 [Fusarium pseudograminearum CS3096]EKJ77354.1 hypothetical protein FPSE_02432 [Fusarium pseudograminearum CS3096]